MTLFHILTMIISVSVFIGLFIYTYVTFNNKDKSFPSDITDCPDYWKVNADGTCQIPRPGEVNLGNLDSRGKQIYTYKGVEKGSKKYSYLPSYFDAIYPKLETGKIEPRLPLGYYQSDIPYGYDSDHPEMGKIDFNSDGWASFGDPYCEIKKWASIQNVQWDGIASYNKC